MADRLRDRFGGTLPVQCIVNEYRPGQGIGMHADHSDFGPVVASLSLAADWPMRFRPRSVRPYARDGLPGDEVAVLPRRSVLVIAGRARRDWMHGIDPADTAGEAATRLSATFRTSRCRAPAGCAPALRAGRCAVRRERRGACPWTKRGGAEGGLRP